MCEQTRERYTYEAVNLRLISLLMFASLFGWKFCLTRDISEMKKQQKKINYITQFIRKIKEVSKSAWQTV